MDKKSIMDRLALMSDRYRLGVASEAIEKAVDMSSVRAVGKGSLLRHIGDGADSAGLVLDGMIRSYYLDKDGNDITRGFAAAATLCMDEGLFGHKNSLTEWEALEDSTLMIFGVDKMKELIYGDETLKNAYLLLLENALNYKLYRENSFLTENAAERYVHFRKLFPEICSRVKQRYIATYLGIAPESLSRVKKSLKEEN